jgi:hypothetical protein
MALHTAQVKTQVMAQLTAEVRAQILARITTYEGLRSWLSLMSM